MGFYIEGPSIGKTEHLIATHGAREVDKAGAAAAMKDATKGVIAIKRNAVFEAAGYCFSDGEFAAFTEPTDHRPTRFVVMDKATAERLSDFKPAYAGMRG